MEDMGYQNTQALYDLNRTGRLAKKRGDNLTCYTTAQLAISFMCSMTYDWDRERNQPPEKLRKVNAPCRYYTLGCHRRRIRDDSAHAGAVNGRECR